MAEKINERHDRIKMEKIITLLYLTTFGDIKMTSFEIPSKERCGSWFRKKCKNYKQRKVFSNLYYHEHNGKQVVGYICADDPPQ